MAHVVYLSSVVNVHHWTTSSSNEEKGKRRGARNGKGLGLGHSQALIDTRIFLLTKVLRFRPGLAPARSTDTEHRLRSSLYK